jgi:hypothetical protein
MSGELVVNNSNVAPLLCLRFVISPVINVGPTPEWEQESFLWGSILPVAKNIIKGIDLRNTRRITGSRMGI